MPFWMYVYGCAATLIVTFAILASFTIDSSAYKTGRTRPIVKSVVIANRWWLTLSRIGALTCLLLTIVSGFIGNPDPNRNIGMILFWVIFVLGLAYLTLFVGDIYSLVNPWRVAVRWMERQGIDLSTPRLKYPQHFAFWIAYFFYVALIWIELYARPSPLVLSVALTVYSLSTLAGVVLFGKDEWFCHAELFSVFFNLIGKLAPIEYREAKGIEESWQVRRRVPLSGALNDRPPHISLVFFVLFMLSSTTYDGIQGTAFWIGLFWRNALTLFEPLWGTDMARAQATLTGWYIVYRQGGLIIFPFLYMIAYLLALRFMRALTGKSIGVRALVLSFCYSLLPIAVAYNFTHYFTMLIMSGGQLRWLVSDPFGIGWNLLSLKPVYKQQLTLQMGVVWHTEVAVLLAGHVASVYMAHIVATKTFSRRRQVIISQLPVLLLMVLYTTLGLTILSLPLG